METVGLRLSARELFRITDVNKDLHLSSDIGHFPLIFTKN